MLAPKNVPILRIGYIKLFGNNFFFFFDPERELGPKTEPTHKKKAHTSGKRRRTKGFEYEQPHPRENWHRLPSGIVGVLKLITFC